MHQMNFVSSELSLPLFLLTRIPLKEERPERVRGYIAKTGTFYTRNCSLENRIETATKLKQKHVVGFDQHDRKERLLPRALHLTRDLTQFKSWHLPPNRYNIDKELFAAHKGDSGAHWPKAHKNKSILKLDKRSPKFYNLPRESERMSKVCHKYKGPFVSNARARRATARCMVSSNLTCYHNPNEPGPAQYYPTLHQMDYNASDIVVSTRPNPHEFYPHSCVPTKHDTLVPRHISFAPAPGRYETRYPRVCTCVPKRIYCPGLQLMIEREKRLKFRRQPYKKIKARLYCCPDWRHVPGNGHRRLFKVHKKKDAKLKRTKEGKKSDRQFQLFPDARYIGLITLPRRHSISARTDVMPTIEPRIIFNCIARRTIRKQLHNNKKIAFLSGRERFKDQTRAPSLTAKQLEAIKATLPLERQLRDQPITATDLSTIKGKLEQTPKHMMAFYELELRKPLFKFHPLPEPKLLATQRETRNRSVDGKYTPPNLYGKPLIPEQYFKST